MPKPPESKKAKIQNEAHKRGSKANQRWGEIGSMGFGLNLI